MDAQRANILVNVVDSPELCSVTFPAIIDRDPLVISVGTAGLAPTLTRFVRELIETSLPERISMLAKYLGSRRGELKRRLRGDGVELHVREETHLSMLLNCGTDVLRSAREHVRG